MNKLTKKQIKNKKDWEKYRNSPKYQEYLKKRNEKYHAEKPKTNNKPKTMFNSAVVKSKLTLKYFNTYKCDGCGRYFDYRHPFKCPKCGKSDFKKIKLESKLKNDFNYKKLPNIYDIKREQK